METRLHGTQLEKNERHGRAMKPEEAGSNEATNATVARLQT
jgi:hypothetical protein